MDANQLAEAVKKVIDVVKPPPEYCLAYKYEIWWMCMTKAEWSGWVQAFGVVIALAIPWFIRRRTFIKASTVVSELRHALVQWRINSHRLNKVFEYEPEASEETHDLCKFYLVHMLAIHEEELVALRTLDITIASQLRRCIVLRQQLIDIFDDPLPVNGKYIAIQERIKNAKPYAEMLSRDVELVDRRIVKSLNWLIFRLVSPLYERWVRYRLKKAEAGIRQPTDD